MQEDSALPAAPPTASRSGGCGSAGRTPSLALSLSYQVLFTYKQQPQVVRGVTLIFGTWTKPPRESTHLVSAQGPGPRAQALHLGSETPPTPQETPRQPDAGPGPDRPSGTAGPRNQSRGRLPRPPSRSAAFPGGEEDPERATGSLTPTGTRRLGRARQGVNGACRPWPQHMAGAAHQRLTEGGKRGRQASPRSPSASRGDGADSPARAHTW